jgi:hypothetical protein
MCSARLESEDLAVTGVIPVWWLDFSRHSSGSGQCSFSAYSALSW